MSNLFDDLIGNTNSQASTLQANKEKERMDLQASAHDLNPDAPAPADLPAPKPQSDILSDITGGIFGNNNSKLIKAHNDELNVLSQAKDQGRIDYNTFLARTSAVTSKYSSMDPVNSKTYQAVGANVLGFNPTEKLIDQSAVKARAAQDQQDAVDSSFINKAASAGLPDTYNSDGTIDRTKAIQQGMALANAEYQIKQDKEKAKDIPQYQQQDQEVVSFRNTLEPLWNTYQTAEQNNLAQIVKANPNMSKEDLQVLTNQARSQSKLQWQRFQSSFLAKNQASPNAMKTLGDEYDKRWTNEVEPLTGDMSESKTLHDAMQALQDKGKISTIHMMPVAAGLRDTLGDQAAASMIGVALQTNPQANTAISGALGAEVRNVAQSLVGKDDPLHPQKQAVDVTNGVRDIYQCTDAERGPLLRCLVKGTNAAAVDPTKLNPKQTQGWGTATAQVLKVSKDLTSKDDLVNAATQMTNPKMVNALATYGKQDPQGAQLLGRNMNDLSVRALVAHARDLRPMNIAFDDPMNPQAGDTLNYEFNPSSGRFELNSEIGIKSATPSSNAALVKLNAMADSAASTKDFGGTRQSKLSQPAYRQALADFSGIATKKGVSKTPYDPNLVSGLVDPSPAQTYNVSGPNNDKDTIKRKIIAAAMSEGVDPSLALGVAHQESKFDPNATSETGARGVMQFTQRTAKWMGIDRENVDQNIHGGVQYLKYLLDKFNGDEPKALHAYNGNSDPKYAEKVQAFRLQHQQELQQNATLTGRM